jgi:hypothetical protein
MSFNLFQELQTDPSLESGGVWVWPYGPETMNDQPTTNPGFKIARMGGANSKFEKANIAYLRPYRHLLRAQGKQMDENVLKLVRDCAKKAFLDTCLIGWKNLYAKDGVTQIEFSRAAAEKLFAEVPQVYTDLEERASDLKSFQPDDVEADAGNS